MPRRVGATLPLILATRPPATSSARSSPPFEAGENKKVAVKIVDDRGIESLRIIALE